MSERALALAYRYLNRRERTAAEVRAHLLGREIDDAGADAAVAELSEHGYLDDERFARLFVEDKRSLEGWGSERIARALRARGIERELVDAALQDDGGGGGDLERALALLERRFPAPPRDRRERDRALGVLLRKGYDPELALDALARHGANERSPGAGGHFPGVANRAVR
jgi:regulatory protein